MNKNKVLVSLIVVLMLGITLSTPIGSSGYNNTIPKLGNQPKIAFEGLMSDMGYKPSEEDIQINSNTYTLNVGDIPDDFTWRNKNNKDWITSVKYQGNCGSCWIFAALGALEAQINIDNNNPTIDVDLSEQYVLSCLPKAAGINGYGCTGGWAENAYEYIISTDEDGNYINGVPVETCMTYQASDQIGCEEKCSDWLDNIYSVNDYTVYDFDDESQDYSIESLKYILMTEGPLAVYLFVTTEFKDFWRNNNNPNDYYQYDGNYDYMNHAVVLVGWHDDPTISNGGYWICKNSWGDWWGYNGYFNLEYGALCMGQRVVSVDVSPSYLINFDYTPQIINIGDVVNFITYDPDVSSYWWDFDNGYYSDLISPKTSFEIPGTYNVKLSVVFNDGSHGIKSKDLIIPSVPPTADFSYLPDTPHSGSEIYFYDESVGVVEYSSWNFGDGNTSTLKNPHHIYSDDGVYVVSLEVMGLGETNYIEKSVVIYNTKPTPNFDCNIDGNEVTFLDTSYDIDGTITSWLWNFGDGETSNEQNPVHIYYINGDITVSLEVIDDDGRVNVTTRNIFVGNTQPDQSQENVNKFESISFHSPVAQTFKPSKNVLDKVEIYIKGYSGRSVTVGIVMGSPKTNGYLTSKTIPTSGANGGIWLEFDLDDIDVIPNYTYSIVVEVDWDDDVSIGRSTYNSYSRGNAFTRGSYGRFYSCSYDFAFRTY